MAIAQGYRSAAYLGWDPSIHTALDNPDYFRVPYMTNGLSYTQALNESAVLRGVRATAKPFFGNRTAEGNFDVPFDADVTGIVFKAMCGNSQSWSAANAIALSNPADWTASTTYALGDVVTSTVATPGVVFVCTVSGESDITEPIWSTVAGSETVDGTATWTATAQSTLIPAWEPAKSYKTGDLVSDSTNGIADTYFVCTKDGISDGIEPVWTAEVGDVFEDGAAAWIASKNYLHKFWVDVNALPYMFIEKSFPDIDEYVVYRGLKANTVSLAVGGDGEMMSSMSLMGVRADDITGVSLSEGTGSETDLTVGRYQFQNFKAALSSSILDEDELAAIRDVSIEFNNNLQGDIYTINSRGSRREIPEGLMSITGSINALFEGTSMISKASQGVEIDMIFSFVEEHNMCRIDLPEARIEPFDPTIDGPEGVTASINFIAYSDNDAKAPVTLLLTNSIPNYDVV